MMSKRKQMCHGCRDDYYNKNADGGCWCFPSAQIVTRVKVGTFEPPPYASDRAEEYLSCFNPDGYAMLELSDCRVKDHSAIAPR